VWGAAESRRPSILRTVRRRARGLGDGRPPRADVDVSGHALRGERTRLPSGTAPGLRRETCTGGPEILFGPADDREPSSGLSGSALGGHDHADHRWAWVKARRPDRHVARAPGQRERARCPRPARISSTGIRVSRKERAVVFDDLRPLGRGRPSARSVGDRRDKARHRRLPVMVGGGPIPVGALDGLDKSGVKDRSGRIRRPCRRWLGAWCRFLD